MKPLNSAVPATETQKRTKVSKVSKVQKVRKVRKVRKVPKVRKVRNVRKVQNARKGSGGLRTAKTVGAEATGDDLGCIVEQRHPRRGLPALL